MTIPVQRSRKLISGSGWVNPLTHDFPIENATDVAVYAGSAKLTMGSHYTVSGVNNPAGYTITIIDPGLWAPDVWVLDVLYPINQPSDVDQGGQFGLRFENALDRMARSDQVIWERAKRSVAVNRTTPIDFEIELPPPVSGSVIGFDSNGQLVTYAPANLGSDLIAVSAYIMTLLDDPDAATARATLGIDGGFARLDVAQDWTAPQKYGITGSATAPPIKFGEASGIYASSDTNISFTVGGLHQGRFSDTGLHVNKLFADIATVGHSLNRAGNAQHVRSGDVVLQTNRIGTPGAIAEFMTSGTVALQVNEVGIDVPINGAATNTNIRFGFGAGHGIYALANTNVSFAIGGVHIGRFSSTGLHITKFAADISTVGHSLTEDGLAHHTRSGNVAMQVNRTGSGGGIAEFMQGGNPAVSISDDGIRFPNGSASLSIPVFTAANIASAAHAVNTVAKRQGLLVWDSTNFRIMVAAGSSATATWRVADGSASVAPA